MSPLDQVLATGGVSSWKHDVRETHDRFVAADAELKAAQEAVEAAAKRRAGIIAEMVALAGTQTLAGKALGIDQSNVSRALKLLGR